MSNRPSVSLNCVADALAPTSRAIASNRVFCSSGLNRGSFFFGMQSPMLLGLLTTLFSNWDLMNLRLHAVKLLFHLHAAVLQPDDRVMRLINCLL
jgi:hypothetical protein